ncbi:gamma-glutamyltransferase [Chloroflexi bacterium]|nr:gamma-glutamyltransferase [Chloroflexota bacterium]
MVSTYKQEVVGAKGVVASNHPLASLAGVEMLTSGGNAIDAAIATMFALSVVEPMMVGITGAGFINYYNSRDKASITIDNYCTAPLAATEDMFVPVSNEWPDYMETKNQENKYGYLSVGVPAALQAWCHVEEKYGVLGIERVTRPAIRFAKEGFAVTPYLAGIIENNKEILSSYPASKTLFLDKGVPLHSGDNLANPDYAETLADISKNGVSTLTEGRLGDSITKDMRRNNGIVSLDDLNKYKVKYREPVRGTYRGYDIVGVGPTSSGATHIIQALNIIEGFNIQDMQFGSIEYIHLMAETLKLVFADRFKYMGDPDFVEIPVAGLISKDYGQHCRRKIDLSKASTFQHDNPAVFDTESKNTTHITVADEAGSVVSMTQTLNDAFGSRVTVPGTGVILNNTMYNFDPHTGTANSIAPGKRVLSSMAPITVFKQGKPFMSLGTPGARRIFPTVLQGIINVIDHNMSLQEAVEAPRIWTQGQNLELETDISPDVIEPLSKKGHVIESVDKIAGGMNGVLFDDNGAIHGAACWRADGSPIALGGGPASLRGSNPMFRV